MKPPTKEELLKITRQEREGASFHRYQLKHSNLDESEKDTERRLEREATLIALACERWADSLKP